MHDILNAFRRRNVVFRHVFRLDAIVCIAFLKDSMNIVSLPLFTPLLVSIVYMQNVHKRKCFILSWMMTSSGLPFPIKIIYSLTILEKVINCNKTTRSDCLTHFDIYLTFRCQCLPIAVSVCDRNTHSNTGQTFYIMQFNSYILDFVVIMTIIFENLSPFVSEAALGDLPSSSPLRRKKKSRYFITCFQEKCETCDDFITLCHNSRSRIFVWVVCFR